MVKSSELNLVQSAVDLSTLQQVIGAAQISFDDLRSLPIGSFKGLFVFRKFKDMKVSGWLRLNQLLANLGYSAVFVAELERLQFFSNGLDQAQEFYQDYSQDFWQNPLLDCHVDVSVDSEKLLRHKLRQALENIASSSSLTAGTGIAVEQANSPGYASVMRFLAGSDCALSPDAFEEAALKLEELERIELVPLLSNLRAAHKVPTVSDYQGAANQIDLEAWLDVRQDAAIELESQAEPESGSSQKQQIAATRAQQLIDSVQYLLLVPVVDTDLAPAFFHMGGVNDMPPAHVHLALMRRWSESYGLRPKILGLGSDSLYVYVAKPVSSVEIASKLAIEHFRYCPDSVLQTLGSVGRLANEIRGCDLWQFWWE
ncbi:DUF4253 domain-containing protein [bacterium]|nr:DUF4253 domain-containing protein [bacterium]MBP9809869.1 DUF4253 domain-containing protein [bacterium]